MDNSIKFKPRALNYCWRNTYTAGFQIYIYILGHLLFAISQPWIVLFSTKLESLHTLKSYFRPQKNKITLILCSIVQNTFSTPASKYAL
jgi:hypothetical protein